MAENVIVRSDLDELTDPELIDFINQLLQNSEIKILSKTIQSMYSKLQNQLNIYKSQLIDASNFGKSLTHKEKKVNKEYQSLRSQARTTLGSQTDMDSLAYQFSKFMFTIHKLQSSVAALSNQQIRLVYVYKSKRKDMNAYILKKLQKHPCLKGCLYQPEQELYELYGKDIIQST